LINHRGGATSGIPGLSRIPAFTVNITWKRTQDVNNM
jgi:hypothetical protein